MITEAQRDALIAAACAARERAYAPYSHYTVGAALLAADGQIYQGVNVENASYGLTVCAERSAVFGMVTGGQQQILAIAVCTEKGGSPCGACRQVLSEFAADDMPIYICGRGGLVRQTTLGRLLPESFGPQHLK